METQAPLSSQDIITLLSKLKAETPEYPARMLAARKAAFISQATTLRIQGRGQGGEGGQQGGSGGPGGAETTLGGSTTTQGILLQTLIGIGLVATMLAGLFTGSFLIHEQVTDQVEGSQRLTQDPLEIDILPVTEISPTTNISQSPAGDALVIVTPEITVSSTGTNTTGENVDDLIIFDDLLEIKKENPGLHLGQTPGPPAAPGLGNPGNINQPDKSGKPDKPKKPEKPGKPK